jgi:hypothetical protein
MSRLFVEIRCYKSRRYPLDQMELIKKKALPDLNNSVYNQAYSLF